MKKLIYALSALGLACPTATHAALVYSNDFNTSGTENDLVANDIGAGLGFVNSNYALNPADSIFGTQYLEIASNPTTGNFTFGRWESAGASVALGTFQTYEFDAAFLDSDSGGVYRTRLRGLDGTGDLTGNADITQANSLGDGTIEHYVFAINNTGSAVTLDATLNGAGLTNTIAAGGWELFQDGDSIGSGSVTGTPNNLALWMQGDNPNNLQGFMYMDDFEVYSNIPEPSSVTLLLGALGLMGVRRRK